jgi:hypothetical protein
LPAGFANAFDAPLWMTRGEWLFARMLTADRRDTPPREAFAYWRAARLGLRSGSKPKPPRAGAASPRS